MTMEPGRELDAIVAEALGLNVVAHDWPCGHEPDGCDMEAWSWPEETPPDHYAPHPVYAHEHAMWPPERMEPLYEGDTGQLTAHVTPVPFYSTNIAAAWEAAQTLNVDMKRFTQTQWYHFKCALPMHGGIIGMSSKEAAFVISRAILIALGIEVA